MASRQINIKCPDELADLVDDVVADAPFIGGRSALVRHGIELAMNDAVERGVITDTYLADRVTFYLQSKSKPIRVPVNGKEVPSHN